MELFRKYRNPSGSSPAWRVDKADLMFQKYRNPSSSSPCGRSQLMIPPFRRHRKSSRSSPLPPKMRVRLLFRRYRKPSRNAERTTKRSTFRLLLKVPEVFESACNYIYAFRHSLSDDGETRPFAKVIRLGDLFWRHIPVLWYNSPIHQSINRKE